ncbi:MAG TPA: hypothetical protein VMB26_00335 [Candidatus Binataceae bacterium]|nr:hypothetical protein [Candidatus Binataceae bacterium]
MASRANLLLLSALLIAGCAEHQAKAPAAMPAPVLSAPAPQPAARAQPDWNIFPDPITGRVEIYRDGVHVGSVTGNEKEDPPVPQKRNNASTDSD